ncbi:MAG TPA: hypothetical protein VIQ54_09885 [Polyangia bacterium]|jgi:hypothetical protein
MTRTLCAALLVLSGLASVARAADEPPMPAPTESAMPAPTESAPPAPGAAGPVVPAGELAEETPPQRQADLSYGVATRLRWVTVPAWMLNLFTKKNVPLSSWGTGIEFFRRKANFDLVLSFSYQNMSPPDGNWLGAEPHPANTDTDYVQFNGLALWGVDLSFVWHAPINEWFGIHFGAGIGVAYVAGEILRTSNDPARCTEANAGDVSACRPVGSDYRNGQVVLGANSLQPGPDDPYNPHRFADPNKPPVLPIVNLLVGVNFRLPQVRGWEARLEGGFYNAFFMGGAIGYTF